MNTRLIRFAVIAALVIIAGVIYWRNTHLFRPKQETPRIRVAAPAAKKRAPAASAATAAKKKAGGPKVAIVMDDFGYNVSNLDDLFDIKEPITLSVLPNLRYSSEIARLANLRGQEVILHMPLEPHRKDVREEQDTIKSGMTQEEIFAVVDKEIASVPGIKGVSNHMGSKATEDVKVMSAVFKRLKKHGLYFFDSLTSENSICRQAAAAAGIRYARRDVFLDNSNDPAYIEKQLMELKRSALRNGRAIAVCHDRKNTISVLAKMMPEMRREGIIFVPLSRMME
ncbi:MAG: divergent polysaccharide deacetylase family protein [Candidatus Omnitrophota bacterium]